MKKDRVWEASSMLWVVRWHFKRQATGLTFKVINNQPRNIHLQSKKLKIKKKCANFFFWERLPTSTWIVYLKDLSLDFHSSWEAEPIWPSSPRWGWHRPSFPPKPFHDLLSVGCSTGSWEHWLFPFAAHAAMVHATQLSSEALDRLPQLLRRSTESPLSGFHS